VQLLTHAAADNLAVADANQLPLFDL